MLGLTFLTDEFYSDYASCSEIEKKKDRPHAQVLIHAGGCLFCIPFRSHIGHDYAFWTDEKNRRGLDFSKAVVISDPARYIDRGRKPHLRQDEFNSLKDVREHEVARRLLYYIAQYQKAKQNPNIPRNRQMLQYSTLQYFEEYL